MTTETLQVECPNGCSKLSPKKLSTQICAVCNSTGFADQDKAAKRQVIIDGEKANAFIRWEKSPYYGDSVRISFLR